MTALTCIIGVCLLEAIVRIFLPQPDAMRWFLSDETYGYVLKKNFYQKYHYPRTDFVMEVKTNSLGHREAEYDLSKSDVKRILLLGDSFVFGEGVNIDDRFDTKLGALLDKSGQNTLIINTGVGGWGTLQQTTYARDHFDLFKPDIIVITFCGNDPDDDRKFIAKRWDAEKGLFYFPGKIFIRNHSQLYRLVRSGFHRLLHNWYTRKKMKNLQPTTLDRQSASIITEEEWSRSLGYLKQFHTDFLRFNPDGILLLQATAPSETNIRAHLSSLPNGEDLVYVDLYDDFVQLEPERRIMPHDGHWSEAVHAIVAKKLYEVTSKLGK